LIADAAPSLCCHARGWHRFPPPDAPLSDASGRKVTASVQVQAQQQQQKDGLERKTPEPGLRKQRKCNWIYDMNKKKRQKQYNKTKTELVVPWCCMRQVWFLEAAGKVLCYCTVRREAQIMIVNCNCHHGNPPMPEGPTSTVIWLCANIWGLEIHLAPSSLSSSALPPAVSRYSRCCKNRGQADG
jgi:hypothetical protein